ncbi:type II secretion system protein GspJ, partial [Pseudomonas sp. MWU12-2115]
RLPAQQDGVALLNRVRDLQVRFCDLDKGARQLSGSRQVSPQGLGTRLIRQPRQGEERSRQVLGPLQ